MFYTTVYEIYSQNIFCNRNPVGHIYIAVMTVASYSHCGVFHFNIMMDYKSWICGWLGFMEMYAFDQSCCSTKNCWNKHSKCFRISVRSPIHTETDTRFHILYLLRAQRFFLFVIFLCTKNLTKWKFTSRLELQNSPSQRRQNSVQSIPSLKITQGQKCSS